MRRRPALQKAITEDQVDIFVWSTIGVKHLPKLNRSKNRDLTLKLACACLVVTVNVKVAKVGGLGPANSIFP